MLKSKGKPLSILTIWKASPELLHEKSLKQIIAIAGDGKLLDGSTTSQEFRALVAEVSSAQLARYANECLAESFPDSGLALQDIINEVGRRLGFAVTYGRYRGKTGQIGNDGLWELPNKHKVIVEVKTTDAYRIDLNVVAQYRKELFREGHATEDASSILVVVGRKDTGDLEAQIRGSPYAWDMRLISVDALLRLMQIKESVDDPDALRRVYELLIPREFTKLDEIVELVFSTAEDAKKTEELPDEPGPVAEPSPMQKEGSKFTPVAFNDLVAKRVSDHLGMPLLKRTRALFSSPDELTQVVCTASREYSEGAHRGYWFAFHPHQKDALEAASRGYAAFGCGSPSLVLLIPIKKFSTWLPGMNMTTKETRAYWHVQIFLEGGKPTLVRKKGQPKIDLIEYQLPGSGTSSP